MGKSVLHIKSEIDCRFFLFEEEKGIVTPGKYLNIEVCKGEQEFLFVSIEDTAMCLPIQYQIDNDYGDYQLNITKSQFNKYSIAPAFSTEAECADVKDEYGVIYSHDCKRLLKCTNKKIMYYRVKEECKCICDWAFYQCELRKITLPNGLTHIGDGAFYGCIGLSDVGLPASTLHVGDVAFDNCFTDPSTITLQGKLLHWGKTCHRALNMLCNIYIPIGQTQHFARILPEDMIRMIKEDPEVCPQHISVNQQFSINEFAEFKGKPTAAGVITVKDPFDDECGEKGMFFGDQPVVFTSHVLDEHSGQNASEIAQDIIRNASQYCVERNTFFKTIQGGPVYIIIKNSQNNQIEKQRNTNSTNVQSSPEQLPKDPVKIQYLFFDTETTGLPKDDSAPASDTRNWPRLVQLAWMLTDEEGNTLASSCSIITPAGFTIPDDVAKVHGINTYKAMREGKSLRSVIDDFLKTAKKARCLVGHNVAFDQKVIGAELCRLGIKDTISTVKAICTMEASKDFCEIPGGYYGYKPPKLQELYQKLFGTTFDNAHDAMADVKATKKCFFELIRRGAIIPPSQNVEWGKQTTFSLQELGDKYGSVSVGHQTMLRADGSEFVAYGLKFGKGNDSCYARFSSRIADDNQKLRDSQFQGLSGVEIGQKIWKQKDDFMVVHKRNSRTGDLMYHKNGEPVFVVYHKSDV